MSSLYSAACVRRELEPARRRLHRVHSPSGLPRFVCHGRSLVQVFGHIGRPSGERVRNRVRGARIAADSRRFVSEVSQLGDFPVHVGVEAMAPAELFHEVAASAPLFGIGRAKRALKLDKDVVLPVVVEGVRPTYQIDQVVEVRQRNLWRLR